MSTSSVENSGRFSLKKELMVESKDATVVKTASITDVKLLKGN